MAPLSVEWQVLVATEAVGFFSPFRDPRYGEVLGIPNDPPIQPEDRSTWKHQKPLGTEQFYQYLKRSNPQYPWDTLYFRLLQLLAELVRVGLLVDRGLMERSDGHTYWPLGVPETQWKGHLWLSQLIGAPLIIPSYGSVTVPITGDPMSARNDNRDRSIGSGLVLDEFHILTAKHVIVQMALHEEIRRGPVSTPVGFDSLPPDWAVKVVRVDKHHELDIAVIEVEPAAQLHEFVPDRERSRLVPKPAEHNPGLPPLAGVAFRDPTGGDETYLFGYPPGGLPDSEDGPNLIVQRGEVVNPKVQDYKRNLMFIYSAIARPGSSGGPIVAQDGRVIGMVVEKPYSAQSSDGTSDPDDDADPRKSFYLGIPGGEIVRALNEMELEHLVTLETFYFGD
jgi:hypothetical protein